MSTNKGISRRQFVRNAAAAAAAPWILSSTGRGAAAPNSRLGLGIIGMGTQARGHLGSFLGNKEVQVLAICDVDTTRREAAKKVTEDRYAKDVKDGSYKGCTTYNDYRELLARKDIDAVLIATPDHWHTIISMEACKAKKDIYCEKPLTHTVHEAKTLIECVRKHERVFQTGSQQRSSAEFRLACELVRSGKIGTLKTVYVNVGTSSRWCDLKEDEKEPGLDWDRWLGPAPMRAYNAVLSPRGVHKNFPDWRQYREYSGGMMTDWGAHHFDIAQWGLGMDESGPSEIIPPEKADAKHGLKYLYANGVEVIHTDKAPDGSPVDGVRFVGTEGEISVNRGKKSSKPESIIKTELSDKDVKLFKSPGHKENWLQCIRSRAKPLCDVEVGARSVTVCHLGNIGYWTRKRFKWDPAKWQVVGDEPEVTKLLDHDRREGYQLPTI